MLDAHPNATDVRHRAERSSIVGVERSVSIIGAAVGAGIGTIGAVVAPSAAVAA